MKILYTNIKLLAFVLILTSTSIFAQQNTGTSCGNAIALPVPTLTNSLIADTMQTQTKFFEVTANSKALSVNITQNSTQSAQITKITILDGVCDTLTPIMKTTMRAADGSMKLVVNGLNTGQTCLIKLERQATAVSNFKICVKKEPNPPKPDPAKNIVLGKPMLMQGYLVLNNQKFNVDHWNISIIKKTFTADSTASTKFKTTTKTMDKVALPKGINYLFIPYEYRGQSFAVNYLVNITGFNSSGKTVVENQNVQINDENGGLDIIQMCGACIPYVPNCAKVCNGNLVAYRIQQYTNLSSNASRYEVHNAFAYYDSTANTAAPFYWYTTVAAFQNDCNAIGMGCIIDNNVGNVIGPLNGDTITYRDPSGTVLSGMVVGIRKTRGKWGAKNYIDTGNQFSNTDQFCDPDFTIQNAVSMMNAYGDFIIPSTGVKIDDLVCIPLPIITVGNIGVSGHANSCFDVIPTPLPNPNNGPVDFFQDFFTATFSCLCENSGLADNFCNHMGGGITGGGTSPLPWYNVMERVIISDLNNTTKAPITIVTTNLFETNNGNGNGKGSGWFKGLSVTLEPGLYSFGMAFNDGEYRRRILEVKTTLVATSKLANLVDIVVFPNPIVGKKYNLKVIAQAKLHFKYEVHNFMGKIVYTKNINVNRGETKIIVINNAKLPSGILFHRFIFSDGSSKTIQTLKN